MLHQRCYTPRVFLTVFVLHANDDVEMARLCYMFRPHNLISQSVARFPQSLFRYVGHHDVILVIHLLLNCISDEHCAIPFIYKMTDLYILQLSFAGKNIHANSQLNKQGNNHRLDKRLLNYTRKKSENS